MKELYAAIPSAQKYLQRIGYSKTPEITKTCLDELISCHVHAVPFENIDVFYGGKVPALGTVDLFEKIVNNRRGGYCFELNGLFCRLLQAIGFGAVCVKVRIMLGREVPPPMTHCAVLVNIEGKRYYCDVGFGGPAPISAIELCDSLQRSGDRCYRIQENILCLEQNGSFVPMMQFEDCACDPVDFIPLNYFCAKSEMEPFVHKLMVSIKTTSGHASIDGNVLKLRDNGVDTEIVLSKDLEMRDALVSYFGILLA